MAKRRRKPTTRSTNSARHKGAPKPRAPKTKSKASAAVPAADWRGDFLEALRRTGHVGKSTAYARVVRDTAYKLRERDEAFAQAWAEAVAASKPRQRDLAEEELDERIYRGIPEPVFYQGQPQFTAATAEGEWCPDDDPRAVRDGDGNLLKIPVVVYRKDFGPLAMKLKAEAPDKYRERVQVTHDGKPDGPRTPAERASAAAAILAEVREILGADPGAAGEGEAVPQRPPD